MPNPLVASIGSAVGGALQSRAQSRAASAAGAAQSAAADAQIAEARRQFDTVKHLLTPYVNAGTTALSGQLALLGYGGGAANATAAPMAIETIPGTLGGYDAGAVRAAQRQVDTIGGTRAVQALEAAQRGTPGTPAAYRVGGQTYSTLQEAQAAAMQGGFGGPQQPQVGLNGQPLTTPGMAQQDAIERLKQGSMFGELTRQGEDAILANAAATGGLRGGDVQGVLAQYRPAMLQGLIDRQLAALGGIAGNGQQAAGALASGGMQTGQIVGQAYGDQGAAQSAAALAKGRAQSGFLTGLGTAAGDLAGQWGQRPANAPLFSKWGSGF